MGTLQRIAIPVLDLRCWPMCNTMSRKIPRAIPLLKSISIIRLHYIISVMLYMMMMNIMNILYSVMLSISKL